MRISRLDDFTKGWFVGDFEPTLFQTDVAEVAIKNYSAGDVEVAHVHKVATELTAVIRGKVMLNGRVLCPGEIALLEPGEVASFKALVDSMTVVVKVPSVKGDKYVV